MIERRPSRTRGRDILRHLYHGVNGVSLGVAHLRTYYVDVHGKKSADLEVPREYRRNNHCADMLRAFIESWRQEPPQRKCDGLCECLLVADPQRLWFGLVALIWCSIQFAMRMGLSPAF